jgi:hypothetical protein
MTIIVYTHPRFAYYAQCDPHLDEQSRQVWRRNLIRRRRSHYWARGWVRDRVVTMVKSSFTFTIYPGLVNRLEDTMGMDVAAIRALSYLFGLVIIIDTAMVVFHLHPLVLYGSRLILPITI